MSEAKCVATQDVGSKEQRSARYFFCLYYTFINHSFIRVRRKRSAEQVICQFAFSFKDIPGKKNVNQNIPLFLLQLHLWILVARYWTLDTRCQQKGRGQGDERMRGLSLDDR